MQKHYDLVVLGTGVAGSSVAKRCREAGWKVAVVDSRPFGGTCALRGCTPKKVLVQAGELLDRWRHLAGKGLRAEEARIDWPELMRFKRSLIEPLPAAREAEYAEAGIESYHGVARFVGATALEVEGAHLQGEKVLIATGSRPATLGIEGEEHLASSDDFLELGTLPRRIVFVGGGYISMEFAHLAARAGSQVHVLHQDERPLAPFDPDLVDRLIEATRELGALCLCHKVKAIEKTAQGLLVHTDGDGGPYAADLVVHGASRVPNVEALDLDGAGVEAGKKGIKVNAHLQSVSNPAVYAAGDVADAPGPQLTPVAGLHAETVAENLLKGNTRSLEQAVFASTVFTVPALAGVGLLEEQAQAQGLHYRVLQADHRDRLAVRSLAAPYAAHKILVEEPGGRILGAHLLGPFATEIINVFALAIQAQVDIDQLRATHFAYPTGSSEIFAMLSKG
ncbi:dihydrolipoyl dehydrogenase family protein [Gloeobacter violaceus]|uniref:Gll4201 protein n=1 Tax=Gloeobacter violaceus (strain ATCC 29082 / PCC 7421) TaxID=251221 RepID=Q7NDN4_GLOVI|nr:NAD(P)/FAD-dependent oxidoreductase [Gloeobacter violaceus]BAC92142.1 gll4201 [Gloeobacter violaceus PCC 7421]